MTPERIEELSLAFKRGIVDANNDPDGNLEEDQIYKDDLLDEAYWAGAQMFFLEEESKIDPSEMPLVTIKKKKKK